MCKLRTKDFIVGATLGAALGAAIALLTAPKPGRELRTDLNRKVDIYKDKGQKMIHNVKNQSEEVRGKLGDVKSKVQHKWIEIRKANTMTQTTPTEEPVSCDVTKESVVQDHTVTPDTPDTTTTQVTKE